MIAVAVVAGYLVYGLGFYLAFREGDDLDPSSGLGPSVIVGWPLLFVMLIRDIPWMVRQFRRRP